MNRVSLLSILLGTVTFAFGFIPYLLSITLGVYNAANILDILVILPTFFLIAFYLREEFEVDKSRRKWFDLLFLISMLLFVEGHGIHWAANLIHAYIRPGSSGYDIAYFLDERLGHAMLFSGAYLSLLCLTLMRMKKMENSGNTEKFGLVGSASLYGFYISLGMIEGQVILAFFPIAIVVLIYLLVMAKRGKVEIEDPWILFYVSSHISFLLTSLLYLAIFGSFIEPSKIFGF